MENKIRIQPKMIEIPADNPFSNDLLNRKTPIEALTNVISNIEGPCVTAVDASWGMGKTTFIRMWEQYLRNKNFPVVSFNAWETDYFADPFAALSGELLQELENFGKNLSVDKRSTVWQEQLEKLKGATHAIFKKTLPVLRVLADTADPSGLGKATVQILEEYTEETSNNHRNTREALKDFRKTLGEAASVFAQEAQQCPLVIIIDELDRCRPSYAIELLEIAKHFFSVDHIIFVLAINRTEVSHSIRAVYGERFNAENYLERFFDIDFKLPDADRKQFIRDNFQAMNVQRYLDRTQDHNAPITYREVANVFAVFLAKADISLRHISQVMRRLGLILAALPDSQPFLGWASFVVLIVRSIDFKLYNEFISGNANDKKVIDTVFSRPDLANIRNERVGNLFEAVIIMAGAELHSDRIYPSNMPSSLYTDYKKWAESESDETQVEQAKRTRAEQIVEIVKSFEITSYSESSMAFSDAIERIELFSRDLTKESLPQN